MEGDRVNMGGLTITRLADMTRGWFVGDFLPTGFRTQAVEVCYRSYKKGDCEPTHAHHKAVELTLIVSGKAKMGWPKPQIIEAGSIVRIEPDEFTGFEALEDTTTVVVKMPSVAGDKELRSAWENAHDPVVPDPDRRPDMAPAQTEPEFAMRAPQVLNLGCGPRREPNTIGLDIYPFPEADVVHDVRKGLPFQDNQFSAIIARHILEHFAGEELMGIIEEMYRVTMPGGTWHISVPDLTSPNRYRDPTHATRDWSADSFMLWEVDDAGQWPIYVGPMYNRKAKLLRLQTGLTPGLDRTYVMEVVK